MEHAITSLEGLRACLGPFVHDDFWEDLALGLASSPMALRLTPHWIARLGPDPARSPVRRTCLPLASEFDRPVSHPWARPDRLGEAESSPISWFQQRYRRTALILLSRACPSYCLHCTRSYMVGPSTPTCAKAPRACWTPAQADELLALIGGRSGVWDVLISGGDALLAPLPVLDALLGVLLGIDTVRNIRLASRLPVVLPQALIQGPLPALLGARAREARTRGTGISLHTQINHPDEISPETAEAARALRDLGFDAVRNQAVLLKGVNDTVETQADLHEQAWRLARVEPYCVYQCEIVPGVEHLRVGVEDALSVERALVGGIPGFCQPRFLVDLPGIGKRPLASRDLSFGPWGLHRWSVETEGTLRSAWHADPQRGLPPEGQAFWRLDPDAREALLVARLGETAP